MVIEQWRFLSVPTCYDSVAVTTCFYNLGLSRLGFGHPTFRMQGERSNRLRHRDGATKRVFSINSVKSVRMTTVILTIEMLLDRKGSCQIKTFHNFLNFVFKKWTKCSMIFLSESRYTRSKNKENSIHMSRAISIISDVYKKTRAILTTMK